MKTKTKLLSAQCSANIHGHRFSIINFGDAPFDGIVVGQTTRFMVNPILVKKNDPVDLMVFNPEGHTQFLEKDQFQITLMEVL